MVSGGSPIWCNPRGRYATNVMTIAPAPDAVAMKPVLSNASHKSGLMSLVAAAWQWLVQHRETVTTIDAVAAGALLMWTSSRNPVQRHYLVRPDGDPAGRAAETFGKAVEQLAADRLDIRLGGIYTLERISRQSRPDYAAAMDVLSAFVRQRARWTQQAASRKAPLLQDENPARLQPWADVAAVVAVIVRRETASNGSGDSLVDLRKTDLRGALLTNAPLQKADFAGANLFRAKLAGANLFKANLSRTNLGGATLVGTELHGANLKGADLRAADLHNADLRGADMCWADLGGADLRGADLRGANLGNARLEAADLTSADLREADASGADFSAARLARANLGGAALHRSVLVKAMLEKANLVGVHFYNANLRGADLRGANLRHADLSWADLVGAILQWADLSGAVLYGADLNGADFSCATLQGTDLRKTDLRGVCFADAILEGAVLPLVVPAAEPGATEAGDAAPFANDDSPAVPPESAARPAASGDGP